MRQIATSNGWTDWQKYPKNRKAIRIQYSKTMESKTCSAFPVMGDIPWSAFLQSLKQLFNFLFCAKGFNCGPPAHTNNFPVPLCGPTGPHIGFLWRVSAAARSHEPKHASEWFPSRCTWIHYQTSKIQVEARAGDVMAGAGGAAGPAPDVWHQPAGDLPYEFPEQQSYTLSNPYWNQRSWRSGLKSRAVCMRSTVWIP